MDRVPVNLALLDRAFKCASTCHDIHMAITPYSSHLPTTKNIMQSIKVSMNELFMAHVIANPTEENAELRNVFLEVIAESELQSAEDCQ